MFEVNARANLERSRKNLFLSQYTYPLEINVNKVLSGDNSVRPITSHPFTYIHNVRSACSKFPRAPGAKEEPHIIVMVKSSAEHFDLRQTVRETWGNVTSYDHVAVVFMLGFQKSVQEQVDTESNINKDVVQETFMDTYRNNTYKTIMSFNWASTYCPHANIALFADDDVYINTQMLMKFLQTTKEDKENMFSGIVSSFGVPYRTNTSKWYVSHNDYPFDFYPPYLAGGAIIASMPVVRKMSRLFPFVKFFPIDDVYLGITARKLGLTFHHNRLMNNRFIELKRLPVLISNHGYRRPDDMKKAFQFLKSYRPKPYRKRKGRYG